MAIVDGKMYRSTNSGSTFSEVTQPNGTGTIPIFAQSVAQSGNTIVAADLDYSMYKSTDGGSSWTNPYVSSSDQVYWHQPRLIMNESNANLVYAYHDNPGGSNYITWRMSSTDGLGTVTLTDASPNGYAWMETYARSLTDSSLFFIYYPGYARQSTNWGQTFTNINLNNGSRWVWYPWADAFVNPSNANYVWYGAEGKLYQSYLWGDSETNITSRLSSIVGTPAGMELYNNSGTWTLRVIGTTGKLAVSTDGANSFSATGSTTTNLSSCTMWHLSSLSTNRNVMVASCIYRGNSSNTNKFIYTRDGGTTWTQVTVSNCSIRDHAQTSTKIYVACAANGRETQPLMAFDY
jgi:hypothetical protein